MSGVSRIKPVHMTPPAPNTQMLYKTHKIPDATALLLEQILAQIPDGCFGYDGIELGVTKEMLFDLDVNRCATN